MNPTTIDQHLFALILKGALFSAIAVAIGLLLSRRCSAHALSLYWRGSLLGLIALPFVALYLPVLPLFKAAPTGEHAATAERADSTEWQITYPDAEALEPSSSTEPAPLLSPTNSGAIRNAGPSWILIAWLIGFAFVLTRWVIARLRAARLTRGAMPVEDVRWIRAMDELCCRGKRIRILISPNSTLPMVLGNVRPVLLLPGESLQWDKATRRSVLAHELTHVRRHDTLFLLIAQCAVALHWINPLAWIAARRLRLADERCADDAVLATGSEPTAYASMLLEFAKRAPAPALGLPLAAPSMAHHSTVGRRVECVLDADQRRGVPPLAHWCGGILAILCTAFAIGAATTQDVGAQEDPATAPPLPKEPLPGQANADAARLFLSEKLKRIIIPVMQFDEAAFADGVDFLRQKSVELDTLEPDPKKKGINIIIKKGAAAPDATLTLNLKNIPLAEALKFVTELAGCRYVVEPIGVVVVPPAPPGGDLFLRTWRVPPDFVDNLRKENKPPVDDAPIGPEQPARKGPPPALRELLEHLGITFPEGASVQFIPTTSSLIMRNNQQNMDLLDALVEKQEHNLPGVIKMRVELYEMPKAKALEIITAADSKPAAGAAIATVKELVAKGEATLLASPSLITRSGQRAKIEAGESIDYVAGYEAIDGKDVPQIKKVLAGTIMEVDPVVGADDRTLDITIAISMARGKPVITKRKVVAPASGLEREIERVSISSQQLTSSFVTLTGQTQLVGNLQSDTVDDPNAVLAFVTATITRAKPE